MHIQTYTPAGKLGKPREFRLERVVHGEVSEGKVAMTASVAANDECDWVTVTRADFDLLAAWFNR